MLAGNRHRARRGLHWARRLLATRDIEQNTGKIAHRLWRYSGVCRASTLEDKVKPVRVALTLLGLLIAAPALAQAPSFTPDQLIGLTAPVALYPDPLLAQVLAAATFYDQLPDAAHWADQHRNLTDVGLANAMRAA